MKFNLDHCMEIISMKNGAECVGFSLKLCCHLVYLHSKLGQFVYFKRALHIILGFGLF